MLVLLTPINWICCVLVWNSLLRSGMMLPIKMIPLFDFNEESNFQLVQIV